MRRSSSSLKGKAAEHKGSEYQDGPRTEEQVPSGVEEDEAGEVGLHSGGSGPTKDGENGPFMAIDTGISQESLVRKPGSDASKRTRLGQHFLKLGSLTQPEEVLIYNRAAAQL